MAEKVPVKKTQSLFDEIHGIRDRIMSRAYELFDVSGHRPGREMEHWLTAERELFWKPAIELEETDDEFRIRAAVAGVDPKDLDIEVDAQHLVVKGESHHEHHDRNGTVHTCEFESGSLFRSIDFPQPVDPDKVRAELKNGLLTVTAKIATEKRQSAAPAPRTRKIKASGGEQNGSRLRDQRP